jgi:shikimate kinase
MTLDLDELSRLDLPYHNLVLTGFLGVGKSTIAQRIAGRLGVDYFDLDEVIELHELMSIAKIRELYGDSRLRALEHEQCRQVALMRRSVVVVPGSVLLDERNFAPLTETSSVVILSCELGEALRRLHLSSEQHYRDEVIRRRMLSRLRREHAVINEMRLIQLDTTHLSVEEESDMLIRYWLTGEPQGPLFRFGPPPRFKPPQRAPVGLSTRVRPGWQVPGEEEPAT